MRKGAKGREFTIRKSERVRVQHEKKSDGVRVDHEKKSDGVYVCMYVLLHDHSPTGLFRARFSSTGSAECI